MKEEYRFDIDSSRTGGIVSPMLFGFNLEVTRKTWYNGLSAQILNNRKFFAYGNEEHIGGWKLSGGAVRADGGVWMPEGSMVAQWLHSAVPMHRRALVLRVRLSGRGEIALRVKIGASETEFVRGVLDGNERVYEGRIIPELTDGENCFVLTVTTGEALLKCVSLMPEEDAGLGLRGDVIEALKALKPGALRFPGGCYAEYYDWKSGLLPPDERPVVTIDDSEWLRGLVLGPTFGQDPQDMNLDDFMEVCRRTGAEPQYTVRLNEREPEDAAKLVEYANGDACTEYGSLRAARGHAEPYHLKHWYIGNELYFFGRGELKSPKTVAERSVAFAKAMKAVDPSIELVLGCRSNTDWNRELLDTVRALDGFGLFAQISYHQYLLDGLFSKEHEPDEISEPATEEGIRRVESVLRSPMEYILPGLRAARAEQVGYGCGLEKLPICYDEWNYCWGRSGHPALALFTAGMLHMLIRHAPEVNVAQTLYFHPINEGLLRAAPKGISLEDGGLAWKLISAHRDGKLILTDEPEGPVSLAATLHEYGIYVTIINTDTRNAQAVKLPGLLRRGSIVSEAYAIDAIWEKAYIANSMRPASVGIDPQNERVTLPAACMTALKITL